MPQLKLRIKKISMKKPVTLEPGWATRVQTNGTAEFEDIVKDAGKNTTMHKAELRMAFELCLDSVTEMLKQGFIVDLGPLGKIYPSCSSGWFEKAEDIKLSDVKPQLYFRAGDEVEAAIKSAKLVWAKGSEDEEEDEGGDTPSGGDEPGGDTPTPTPDPTPDPSGDSDTPGED
jgi:nucleoid DNA-binding protein